VIGTWQNRPTGAKLVFDADGTFTATDLPYQEFEEFDGVLPPGFDPELDKLPGSGSWSANPPFGSTEAPRSRVELFVKSLAGRPTSGSVDLRAERAGPEVVLTFTIDDPDLRNLVMYEKCDGACPTTSNSP
jgi:hypothetical protein